MVALNNFFNFYDTSMVLVEQSQRPYRFGMTLLCVGALFNWLGVADSYSDPVPAIRYIGVGLIAAGAILICLAMCFWMKSVRPATINMDSESGLHVETLDEPEISTEKPPDYASVVDVPPCYEDAIKLNPAALLPLQSNNSYVEKPTPVSKDDPARVIITNDVAANEKKDCKKFGETATSAATAGVHTNNSLSKVLRKSIRGIRRQLSTASATGEAEVAYDRPTNVADGPATSRLSYNVISVIPSGYIIRPGPAERSSNATSIAENSKTSSTNHSAARDSDYKLGDPPSFVETFSKPRSHLSYPQVSTAIDAAMEYKPTCSSFSSARGLVESSSGNSGTNFKGRAKQESHGSINEEEAKGGNCKRSAGRLRSQADMAILSKSVISETSRKFQTLPESQNTAHIDNMINGVIPNAESDSDNLTLSYIDASKNR